MEAIFELTDVFTQIRHKLYLRSFEKNCESKQFILDGSDWARLVMMRKQGALHIRSGVFWTRLHSTESPLHRERKARQRGLQHWFMNDADNYDLLWRYAAQEAAKDTTAESTSDVSLMHLLGYMADNPVSITDAEEGWLKSRSSGSQRISSSDQSAYWLEAERGAFEGGRAEKKRLLICAGRN